MRVSPCWRQNIMMNCPTCGHRLARLADPCLHCASLLAGRAGVPRDAVPAASAPTNLTLPAELRVTDPRTVMAPLRPLPDAARAERAASPAAQAEPGTARRAGCVRASGTPETADPPQQAVSASTAPEPAPRPRAAFGTRNRAAAGAALLLVVVVCLGVLRQRDPTPALPVASEPSAAIAAPTAPPAIEGTPSATAREVVLDSVPPGAPTTTASMVAVARPKPRPSTVKSEAAASPAALPSPQAAAIAVATTSGPVADPVPASAPEPAVTDPREACGKRGFIAAAVCINERCAQPTYAGHAQCVQLRRAAEDAELALQRGG